jgi:hypothetical protein
MNNKVNPIHPAPIMRFLVELTTWIWLLMISLGLAIDSSRHALPNWFFFLLLLLSLGMLSQLNFPSDKKPHGKMVRGEIRIFVEIFSSILGIFGAWILFDNLGGFLQLVLTLISFYLDLDRWKWFLGRNEVPPDYVIALGNYDST